MSILTFVVIVAAIVLILATLALFRNMGINRVPLIVYVIGVAVVWAVVLGLGWFIAFILTFSLNSFSLTISLIRNRAYFKS